MRKYNYIDKRNGERVYSDLPLRPSYFQKVTEIRGGTPEHMEKSPGIIREKMEIKKTLPAKKPKRIRDRTKTKETVSPLLKDITKL